MVNIHHVVQAVRRGGYKACLIPVQTSMSKKKKKILEKEVHQIKEVEVVHNHEDKVNQLMFLLTQEVGKRKCSGS